MPQLPPTHRDPAQMDPVERRLHHLAMAAEVSREVYEDDLLTRDRAVIAAVEEGHGVKKVARWAHISTARLMQILARPEHQAG